MRGNLMRRLMRGNLMRGNFMRENLRFGSPEVLQVTAWGTGSRTNMTPLSKIADLDKISSAESSAELPR